MKRNAIITLSAVALTLAACGKRSADPVVANNEMAAANEVAGAPVVTNGDQAFVNAAAASDAFEIASSKLALARSSSASIKKFAQSMIDAHTSSTVKLQTAASGAASVTAPDLAFTADQQAKLNSLATASGAAFDTAYVTAQIDGHQKALDMLQAYSATGADATLKSFATATTPIVAAHLNMAKSIKL